MNKCNLECECRGAGKCCLECDLTSICKSVCSMLDIDKPRLELENTMKNCDWHQNS